MNFETDIPLAIAIAAHSGTSHDPDKRGAQERASYAATLAADYASLTTLADSPEKVAQLDEEFARYRDGYRRSFLAYLGARSRCMSTMITGGSNFPVARQNKLGHVADRRGAETLEFRTRALAAIRRVLQPELAPIMAGDEDAIDRLTAKLASAEELQTKMRAANAAIRKYKRPGPDAQVAALCALGFSASVARELLTPDFAGRIGFADFHFTNNGATIRRLRQRIETIGAAKAQPTTEVAGEIAKLEDAPADNRIRIFFSGKPDADVRGRLKGAGFRWTPSLGCWQAYRSDRARQVAEREAGAKLDSAAAS